MALERPNSIIEGLVARLPASPDAYVQKFDAVREMALVIQFDANAYRAASFLDDRILGPATKGGWVRLARVIAAARNVANRRPLHFIFHFGHVGSTLVSRLLDESGGVFSLREPLTLRLLAEAHDVVGEAHSLMSQRQFEDLLDALLALWSRGYGDDRAVIVKATSSAGRMATTLLGRNAGSRAIYLSLKPEPYLATLLAGANSLSDLRGHAIERARRLPTFDVALRPIHSLSHGELAAMSWLAEGFSRDEARVRCGERILFVDFDAFLGDVSSGLRAVLGQFGLPVDEQFLGGVASSQALTRYAKAPEHAYTPALRSQILEESRARNGEEIRKGLAWLEETARSNARAAAIFGG